MGCCQKKQVTENPSAPAGEKKQAELGVHAAASHDPEVHAFASNQPKHVPENLASAAVAGPSVNQISPAKPAAASDKSKSPFSLKEVLDVLNDVRKNPSKYVSVIQTKYISDLDSSGVLKSKRLKTHEGLKVFQETQEFLKKAKSMPPLSLDCGLTAAAYLHSCYMSEKDNLDHTGRGGSDVKKRINEFGKIEGQGVIGNAENILFTFNYDAVDFILNFIVDDGVPNRGHRMNIFRDGVSKVGLGVKQPPAKHKHWYFTMDFAYDTYKGQKSMIPGNVLEESGLKDYSQETGINF